MLFACIEAGKFYVFLQHRLRGADMPENSLILSAEEAQLMQKRCFYVIFVTFPSFLTK